MVIGTETYFYLKQIQCEISNVRFLQNLDICFKQTTPGTYIIMGYALSTPNDSIDDEDLYSRTTLDNIKGDLQDVFNNQS